jgi:hypothetical protein
MTSQLTVSVVGTLGEAARRSAGRAIDKINKVAAKRKYALRDVGDISE